MCGPDGFDYLGLPSNNYSQLRRYTPAFLDAFEFRAAPAAQKILDGVEMLKRLSASKARSVPDDAPTDLSAVAGRLTCLPEADLDRRYYELCTLTELRNALRSGDIWRWQPAIQRFEDYLLPTAVFEALLRSDSLPLVIAGNFDRYWTERETLLRRELQKVDGLARHELPDADFVDGVLKVTPLTGAVPEEAEALMRQAYALLPHVKVTDLLLEVDVDRWTSFTEAKNAWRVSSSLTAWASCAIEVLRISATEPAD